MYPSELMCSIFMEDSHQKEILVSGNLVLIVNRAEHKGEIRIPAWRFTMVGQELLRLIPNVGDEAYLESLGRFFLRSKCRPVLGRIIEQAAKRP